MSFIPIRHTTTTTVQNHVNLLRRLPLLTLLPLLLLLLLPHTSHAFQYQLPSEEITAPEMLCFSGDASALTNPPIAAGTNTTTTTFSTNYHSLPCPATPEEVKKYPAVVMDEGGYVKVTIKDVIMRDDGRRPRHPTNGGHRKTKKNHVNTTSEVVEIDDNNGGPGHHLQVYLVSLENYFEFVNTSQCCYELEVDNHHLHLSSSKNTSSPSSLPKECIAHNNKQQQQHSNTTSFDRIHDYRINAPRIGQTAAVSAPMIVNDLQNPIDIAVTLRPLSRGRHMVVISNCAAELHQDEELSSHKGSSSSSSSHDATPLTARPIKAVARGGIEITFTSRYGELPLSMSGILPFYGILFGAYSLLTLTWHLRTLSLRQKRRFRFMTVAALQAPPLGLQTALRYVIGSQTLFCGVAFGYYHHLNDEGVDVQVLYSGTLAAALIDDLGVWSVTVAICHFVTVFGCQVVVTLATDGTWLIQNNVRRTTKVALVILALLWLAYFISYGSLDTTWRLKVVLIGGLLWVLFLMCNLRNSLRHLRSLMVGQSEDVILAIGGAVVAKRSLYRKMFVIVAVYPLVFLGSLFLTSWSREDSWAWVGYVLGDIYLFAIILPAACIWMPRAMEHQDYAKYAPLDVSLSVTDDSEVWETGSFEGETWGEDISTEIELS